MIVLLFSAFISCAYGGHIIVTDFDDTIRHTNASSTTGMIWNLLFKRKKIFSGMPQLLNGMGNNAEKLIVLTGSPEFIRPLVKKTLRKSNLKYDQLITKDKRELHELGVLPWGKLDKPSTYYYKIYKISQILITNPESNILLLGDDAGGDPEVFLEIAKIFPGRVDATYIRAIKNRNLPDGMVKFVSAYDVAWLEMLAGRLDKDKLPNILKEIMTAKNFRTTIPNFAYCPVTGDIWSEGDFPVTKKLLQYSKFIMKECNNKKE